MTTVRRSNLMAMKTYQATVTPVIPEHSKSRGRPPETFLDALVEWGRRAPEEVFAPNRVNQDIYASVKPELGPWDGPEHRRAMMLEVLRVLAGFESSWNWKEGRDLAANNTSPETEETGIFQVSANSMAFDGSLRELVWARLGTVDARAFIRGIKADHELALEYAARWLRFTVRHNGPVLRREIHCCVRRDAVEEFRGLLR